MDALFRSLLIVGAVASLGAGYRTPNFVITAPTEQIAKQVGEAAEIYRKELAIDWTGKPLPGNWSSPCPIEVDVGNTGARGETRFNFQNGEVFGWKMEIHGTEQRILDSVLPHEINHTIFASIFRRPLPRWADEGAASLIENESERMRLRKIHDQVMRTPRKIPLKTLLEMKNYPTDNQQVLTMYAEGHSLADYLVQRSDKPTYLKFLQMAHDKSWNEALKCIYQFESVESLEMVWDDWVLAGSPALNIPKGSQLADNTRPAPKKAETIRGQSPEPESAPTKERADETKLADQSEPPRRLSRKSLELPMLTLPAKAGASRVSNDVAIRP